MAQGYLELAQTQINEILKHLETEKLDGTDDPFRVYLTCYQVLRANDDPRAGHVLDTAYRLLQMRAGNIDDEQIRRSFLNNVPAHREILAKWAEERTGTDA
jgi:hypothetical protein